MPYASNTIQALNKLTNQTWSNDESYYSDATEVYLEVKNIDELNKIVGYLIKVGFLSGSRVEDYDSAVTSNVDSVTTQSDPFDTNSYPLFQFRELKEGRYKLSFSVKALEGAYHLSDVINRAITGEINPIDSVNTGSPSTRDVGSAKQQY